MLLLLLFLLIIVDILFTWLASQFSLLNIQASRSIASSNAPGELTVRDKLEMIVFHMVGFLIVLTIFILIFHFISKGKLNARKYRRYAMTIQLVFFIFILFFIINYAYLFSNYPTNIDSGYPFFNFLFVTLSK
jgi:hypothetical protein